MRVAADHLAQHPARNALAPMAGIHGHVGHAAGVGIVLDRQVQQETDDLVRVVQIGGNDQLHRHPFRPVQSLQIQVHLVADRVLVDVVQQVARRDGDHADVGQVVDHQLQDLTVDRLRARGFVVGDLGHCGD
ncbi:hypothetical protein D3C76_1064810 [compost metagenome]